MTVFNKKIKKSLSKQDIANKSSVYSSLYCHFDKREDFVKAVSKDLNKRDAGIIWDAMDASEDIEGWVGETFVSMFPELNELSILRYYTVTSVKNGYVNGTWHKPLSTIEKHTRFRIEYGYFSNDYQYLGNWEDGIT